MSGKTKWDVPTKIFHWTIGGSLIALFVSAIGMEVLEETLGKTAEIKLKYIHLYLGIALSVAVAGRILWGFFGNDSVNWRGVPSGIAKYPGWVAAELDFVLRGVDSDKRKKGGHNPLAIPVYILALILVLMQTATGLGLWSHLDAKAKKHGAAGIEKPAAMTLSAPADLIVPKAYADDDDDEGGAKGESEGEGGENEFAEEVHEFGLFWVPMFLILHLGGMFIHRLRGETGLLKDMTTGA